jgi:putative ABC transport system substrate-binding protein
MEKIFGHKVPPTEDKPVVKASIAGLRGLTLVSKFFCIIIYAGFVLNLSGITAAQEIAILNSADINAYSEAISAFKTHLPLSFRVTQEYDLQGKLEEGRKAARHIQSSNAQVVLAVGLKAALAAKKEIQKKPVIFCLVVDPEKYGLPGNNMIGLSLEIPFRLHVQPLQWFFPTVSRIGVLFDPQKTNGIYQHLVADAKAAGMKIISKSIYTEQDVPMAFYTIKDHIDALWLLPDSTVLTENTVDFLMGAALEVNIPLVGFSPGMVRRGALVGAYSHYVDIGSQAAVVARKLGGPASHRLLGTMVPPERIHQSINLKSARYLHISLSPDTLRKFDEQF